jgi:serine/threonine-protein kinase RsbW
MSRREPAPPQMVDDWSREIALTIPVAPDMELVATAQAAAVGEYMEMTRDKIDEVKLALVEACINAFEHSHTRDGRINVAFRIGKEASGADWLEIEVRDQGQGFDTSTVEAPSAEKTFGNRRKRGWGLQIIKCLMDHVEISAGEWGTRIVMRKYK